MIGIDCACSSRIGPKRSHLGWRICAAVVCVAALACNAVGAAPGDGSRSPTVAGASATPEPDFDAGVTLQEFPPGGQWNEVRIENRDDLRFKARASIRLQREENDDVKWANVAFARGSCTDCQTFAVAVQVVLHRRGAPALRPENVALAANVRCTRCVTVARAIQYVIPVDDTMIVPSDVDRLVKDMDKELRFLASIKTWDQITSDEALGRIKRVLDKYSDLERYLVDVIQRQTAPTSTP